MEILHQSGVGLTCRHCSTTFPTEHGILRLITKQRLHHFAPFLDDYTRIRHAEGRGSQTADYYLRLPEPTMSDPFAGQWQIRNTSYKRLCAEILSRVQQPAKIADLGAGVGWLSNRLADLGHHPIAIDLTVDQLDGLAASSHYGGAWPRVQAEFDRLPLANNQADMVVFNASFHYSSDYLVTLRESLRVLRSRGQIVIIDSPVYKRVESGERMKSERHDEFEQRFGFRSDNIGSIEYLTWDMLRELGAQLGLRWRTIMPWYGWRWALRPLNRRLTGKREPSRFALISGTRIDSAST